MFSNRSIAAAALLALAACGSKDHGSPSTLTVAVAPVHAVAAATVDWPESYEAPGTVHATATMTIAARVMGYVKEIRPNVGDRVTAGQTLVIVDVRELDTGRARAESGLAEARSGIPEAEAAIGAASAQLQLADVTLRRMKDLLDKQSVSRQEFDEAAARMAVARSAVEMARARRKQLDDRIEQARRAVDAAGIDVSHATLSAPFAGRVIARKAEPGTLASPGLPLLEIEREGSYRFEARVEESRLASVRRGTAARVKIDAIEEPMAGAVVEIVPEIDEASRAFGAKIGLPGHPLLRTGLFGRATFAGGTRRVLTIPAAAVSQQGQLSFVMIAGDGLARLRLVKTGAIREGSVEILAGLAETEAVIHPRPAGLADGAKVEVRP